VTDELIRRSDALAAVQLGDTVTKLQARIAALPQVQLGNLLRDVPRYSLTDLGPVEGGQWLHEPAVRAALEPAAPPKTWPEGFFHLTSDTLHLRCATEGCGQRVRARMEVEGIGSDYCEPCILKIIATVAAPDPDETTAEENVGILSARVDSLLAENALLRRQFAMGKAAPNPAAIREAAAVVEREIELAKSLMPMVVPILRGVHRNILAIGERAE